jgi:hypothetical protein
LAMKSAQRLDNEHIPVKAIISTFNSQIAL